MLLGPYPSFSCSPPLSLHALSPFRRSGGLCNRLLQCVFERERVRARESLSHMAASQQQVYGRVDSMQGAEDLEGKASLYVQDGSVDIRGQPALRAKTGNWRACPFILGNEACERLAYYGINTNLVVFLTTQLNQNKSSASVNVTNWAGTCYITPLIGAFLADAYLGRFWTIAIFSAVYFVGMVLLTLTTAVPSLTPKNGDASLGQLAAFYTGLYLIALGTGGIKPCVSSFGADQFDDNDPREKKNKVSFFNWFYFSINIGALISSSVLVYIQDNVSWTWGFGIPAVTMGLAIISFFSGSSLFRHQKPGGSPITRILQVIVAAIRNHRLAAVSHSSLLYETKDCSIEGSRKLEHTDYLTFLDKAATPANGEKGEPDLSAWKLCTVTQVEEVKTLSRLLPIWATSIVFSTVYSQMSTLFVLQGQGMDTSMGPHFKVPEAALSIFDTLSVIMLVPAYDRLLVPIVRRYTKDVRGFTQLQRMGIGLIISISSMTAAAIVEIKRLAMAKDLHLLDPAADTQAVPISIFWQVPQYFLVGAAEVFTFIGQLEFFYDQAPDAMRSMCSALSLTTVALGSYLSSLLVTIVTKISTKGGKPGWIPDKNLNVGHVDFFFWLLAILSFINLLCYMACAHWYTYKKPHADTKGEMVHLPSISVGKDKDAVVKQG